MTFTGHIVAWYPAKTGTYLGENYKFMDVVAVADKPYEGTARYDRITFRVKNKMLDELNSLGCLEKDGTIFCFSLLMDATERHRTVKKTDITTLVQTEYQETYPDNKLPVLIGIANAV